MDFKDLLERYKSDTATEQEKEIVEQEIEKTRLIQDYLEEIHDDLDLDLNTEYEEDEEIKKISSKITKNRRKIITYSVALAIGIIIAFQLIVVPLLNSFFYNPHNDRMGSHRADFTIMLDTFSKLHFPDYYPHHTMVEDKGIGKYNFTAFMGNKFTKFSYDDEYLSGTINRGKIEFDFNLWTKFPAINIFYLHRSSGLSENRQRIRETKEKIRDLPPHIYLSAYISFERDLSMEEFSAIYQEFYERDLFVNWVGVREVEGSGHRGPLIGFAPPGAEPRFAELEEEYPYFNISTYTSENKGNVEPEVFERHFKELLQFQLDNIEFLNMIENDIVPGYGFRRYYQSILDYVNENGVYTYGIKVQGTPENILKIAEHEALVDIRVDDIRVKLP